MELSDTKKTAVMIGAGNIGRGFVGAAFAASGYDTVFIDVDDALVKEINARGEYPLRVLLPDGGRNDTVVSQVRAVNGNDTGAAAAEIAQADICATAVGVRALPHIAPAIAMGLAMRAHEGKLPPLNFIVCENMLDAGAKLREYVLGMTPPELVSAVDDMAGYPEAVIGRMVPIQMAKMKDGDPLRICVEKYAFLPVNKAAFKGEIPQVEGMTPLDKFEYYTKRKLFIHNLGHAAVAYLGLLGGYKLIADAVDDADILFIAACAMRESAAALGCENNNDAANLSRSIESLLYRFSNRELKDTCARVAADPIRKLGRHDRIIGALKNCEEFGLPAYYIAAVGAAAAFSLETIWDGSESLPPLTEITGLPGDSDAYKLIISLGNACSSALARRGNAVKALRRAAVKMSGDITIL